MHPKHNKTKTFNYGDSFEAIKLSKDLSGLDYLKGMQNGEMPEAAAVSAAEAVEEAVASAAEAAVEAEEASAAVAAVEAEEAEVADNR